MTNNDIPDIPELDDVQSAIQNLHAALDKLRKSFPTSDPTFTILNDIRAVKTVDYCGRPDTYKSADEIVHPHRIILGLKKRQQAVLDSLTEQQRKDLFPDYDKALKQTSFPNEYNQ
ncbi:MAG: hypothetical protein KGL39_03060 [Patescibacteria group bacterium]|nr:hypothetical protein [Patescibacteria group bacterium]